MNTFLDDIANELLKSGKNDFSQTCIVLPNRRAGVFLRDAISRQSNKALWAPKVLSIEDFVFSLSPLVKADPTTLLFHFYEVYKQAVPDAQSIEMFANWAPTFLSDVNELDLNLIDAQDIFAQLYSVERIERWNPETGKPTEFQEKHLNFVKQFYTFYQQLRQALSKRKVGYQGMAFRNVAENAEQIIAQSEWEQVWFAGFNALTISEERIIQQWQSLGKAKLFWDVDSYYADVVLHEAGHYTRRYAQGKSDLKIDPNYNWKSNRLTTDKKEVQLIAVQRTMAQAQVAGHLLQEKLKSATDSRLSNTAVVLNNEELLIPLLSAMPTNLEGVNITMGYGLPQSQSAVLIDKLFGLYTAYLEQGKRFSLTQVLAVHNDVFYRTLAQADWKSISEKEKRSYLALEELQQSALDKLFFDEEFTTVQGFLSGIKRIAAHVATQKTASEAISLEHEFLVLLDGLAQRLLDLHQEFGQIDTLRTLHTFWKQLIRLQQLDFVGEPLQGLQIMGMLETRNLDFEEVIMLGVNEGSLPSTAHSNSYFTFDIRRAYGLACQNERDAVTAYHFYRLLQRAKKVYLVYDQDTDSLGRGEVSRYVRQLMMEKTPNIKLSEHNLEQVIPSNVFAPEITIPKTDAEFKKLLQKTTDGFSPSALNAYRSCSLKYYFRYVAEIKEPRLFTHDIDHAKFGTAVHDTLEELLKPHLSKPLSVAAIQQMKQQVVAGLETQFAEQLASNEPLSGKNLLAFEVAKSYVEKVLDHDLKTTQNDSLITPLLLEEELRQSIEVEANGTSYTVLLKGMADRIDRLSDGTTRLIDYKTGSFKLKTIKIQDVTKFESPNSDHAFQLLMYLVMFARNNDIQAVQPTVFYLRSQQVEHAIEVTEDEQELHGQELLAYATERVSEVLAQLLDKQVPFSQTEKTEVCTYCDFNQVCQR